MPMKIVIGVLVAVVIVLAAAVVWIANPGGLTASEVAKGMGMHYWLYRVPSTHQVTQTLGIEVSTPDGVHFTGGGSGFEPGETLKVFVTPIGDGTQLRWSIVGDHTSVDSTLDNPLKGLSITLYLPDGSLVKDGILMVGNNGSVSLEQPKVSDTIIRIAKLDPTKQP